MRDALKHRDRERLELVAARTAPRQASLRERIAAIAALGASTVPAGRCAIAWDDVGAECIVLAPANDSRWRHVAAELLAALANRMTDVGASIGKVALSAREMGAIMGRGRKIDIPPLVDNLGFTDGARAVRIVLAARGEGAQTRSSGELEALLELLAGAVFAEIARAEADKSREFWRADSAERVRHGSILKKELERERAAARDLDAAVAATRAEMERDAAARSGLARQLALRMFAAIDDERARIARDLHDDQAQLLAAAMIALEGGREEARAIFKQIESELRRKTRALRPATLGRATLDEAIEREFGRLADAGIIAKLVHECAAEKISRPVQQLCFQVVREALSNVIRHARAKSVEVIVERTSAAARVSVIDDGCGIDPSTDGEGSGLAGVRERLELMGGRLTIESRAGRTTVVAEIPELS